MHTTSSDSNFKKSQSLNIDPTLSTNDDTGFLAQSPDHVNLAANTATVGV
jgi:hypothetical protein